LLNNDFSRFPRPIRIITGLAAAAVVAVGGAAFTAPPSPPHPAALLHCVPQYVYTNAHGTFAVQDCNGKLMHVRMSPR